MKLEIITPDKSLFSGDVKLVQLPGSNGSFELLNNHAPLIATLKAGTIKIEELQSATQHTFVINGGVIEVNNNKAIVLAE
ncbi:MAG: ATP synthase F1 subunit epsilon [Bacteroidia bacterium]|jgi:F-type H+-transporting ATPase subunit epsilon|nr:ATP synthase F1 subunit epsilon [Bacteroidia bacterium]